MQAGRDAAGLDPVNSKAMARGGFILPPDMVRSSGGPGRHKSDGKETSVSRDDRGMGKPSKRPAGGKQKESKLRSRLPQSSKGVS